MRTKYQPLELYLLDLPTNVKEITLTFQQIEDKIGSSLPHSANRYREWWANQVNTLNRPQARAWTNAGFAVDFVHQDGDNPRVHFRRRST